MASERITHITTSLPETEVCRRLGVAPRSLRLARERGVFPASWYRELKAICEEHNIPCSEDLFNFKTHSASAPSAEVQ